MASDESFYLQNLFYTQNAEPMQFSMRLCREWEKLYEDITRCGGNLTTGKGPHTIRLLPSDDCIVSSHGDNFKTQYIYDCIKEGHLLAIGDYRVEKHSCYDDQIDPMDILMGVHSWSDCQRINSGENAQVNDDAFFDEVEPSSSSSTAQASTSSRKAFYTNTEKKAIVDFIIEKEMFNDVKGVLLWRQMEKDKVCPGRTWQSLKNHYQRLIIPNLEPFKLPGSVVRLLLNPYVKEPAQLSDSDPEDQEDIVGEEKREEQEVEMQMPITSPKKPSLEKSPIVIEEDRTNSPKKLEEVQTKSRDCIAQEEEVGSGETKDQVEQVGSDIIGDQEEQARSIENINLKVQAENRETEVPEVQLGNTKNESNCQTKNRQRKGQEECPENIQSSRFLQDNVVKMKNIELEKQIGGSMSKNEEVSKETEKRGTTTRKNVCSKVQEVEIECVIEKQSQEAVCCAETSADSQKLHQAVECSRDFSSQSVIKQHIQECNNNNKATGVSEQEKPVKTNEISNKQSRRNDGATYEKPIRMIEDTHQIADEDATHTKMTAGVVSGQVISLNCPSVSSNAEGELILTRNIHECDKDLKEQEDDTTAVGAEAENPLSSVLPTLFSVDDIHSSVRSPKHLVSIPVDAFNMFSPKSPCNTGNNTGENCEDVNSSPSLLEKTVAGTVYTKVSQDEFFPGGEENLYVEDPKNECRNEVQIGTERGLISQTCHSQSVDEKTSIDQSSKKLKDSACDVKVSKHCNEDSPASQLSDFFASVSEDDTCTDLYESAKDTGEVSGHMSLVKNSELAMKLPNIDLVSSYFTESDGSDGMSGILFDAEEEFALNLQPSSSNNSGNTAVASFSKVQDNTNVAFSFKVEATDDVCDLSKETEKGCKSRILEEHQDEAHSSHLGHVLKRDLSSTDALSSSVSEPEGDHNAKMASGDEDLAQSKRGLPSARKTRAHGKGQTGSTKCYSRRIHRSASTSSNSSTEDNREKVVPKKKRKVVERRKRGPSAKSENTSGSESPVRRWVAEGNVIQKKNQLQYSSSLTLLDSEFLKRSEKEDSLESSYLSEIDTDPASNIDCFTGRFDRTFIPNLGCTTGLRRKNCENRIHRIRDSYTVHEDVDILKYIEQHKAYHRVGGRELWQEMEGTPTFNHRTWHSLKERFRKRIMPRLHTYIQFGVPKESLNEFLHCISIKQEDPQRRAAETVTYRQPYSYAEDCTIIKFITKTKRYSEVGGKSLWELMAVSEPALNGRTWLSLKERFRKSILPRIDTFMLTKDEVDNFKNRTVKKQHKKKSPTKRIASDRNVSRCPYDYNERSTGKRRKLTQSMLDLKLKSPSKAKTKHKLRELDKFDEEEKDQNLPSTSGYVPPQECSSSELESDEAVRTVQPARLKRRGISNRDSSNDVPQKKRLFTSNNSPTSDDLSPQTPFTQDNSTSSMRSYLKKKKYKKLTATKLNHNIKDVRIILDRSWLDKRVNQTGETNSGQNSVQKTSRPEKKESTVWKVEEKSTRGRKASTKTDETTVIPEKNSCTNIPREGAKHKRKSVKGHSNANGDGCGTSSSGKSRMKWKFFKTKESSKSSSSLSSLTQKKCTNTPAERDLEAQRNVNHPQEDEIIRDKSQQVSEQETCMEREAMQSKVNQQRRQDFTLTKPCSISISALDAQSRVRDKPNTAESPTSNKDEIKRSGTSMKSRSMDTRDTSSSSDSKTSCSIKAKGAGTETSSVCRTPDKRNSVLLNTNESCNLKKASKGSTSDSALIDVGNFQDTKDSDRVQTDSEVKRKRVGGHSERKTDSKVSVVERRSTRILSEMTLPMGKLRKREVKKRK